MPSPVPRIEISDHADGFRIRGPDSEMNAFDTVVKFFHDSGLFIYPSILIMALGLAVLSGEADTGLASGSVARTKK